MRRKVEQVAHAAPKRVTTEDLLQLLRNSPGVENALAEDDDEKEPDDDDGDDQDELVEQEESSDDDDFARNRLLNFAGAAPEAPAKSSSQSGAKDLLPKAKAKAPTATQRERHVAQASGPVARITSGPAGSLRSTKFRAGSLARSNSNRFSNAEIDRVPAPVTRPQVEAIELDGRGMRVKDTLQTEIEKVASGFATLASGLASDTYALNMSVEERRAFDKRVHSHMKELSKLTTSIKASSERLSKSSNKKALRAEQEELDSWQKKVDNLVTFLSWPLSRIPRHMSSSQR